MHVYHVVAVYPAVPEERVLEEAKRMFVNRFGYDYAVEAGVEGEEARRLALEIVEEILGNIESIREEMRGKTIEGLDRRGWLRLSDLLDYMGYCAAPRVQTVWAARKRGGLVRLIVKDHETALKAIRAIHAAKKVIIIDAHW